MIEFMDSWIIMSMRKVQKKVHGCKRVTKCGILMEVLEYFFQEVRFLYILVDEEDHIGAL